MSLPVSVLRARSWLYDLFVHHHAEQLRIQRAVQRKVHQLEQTDLPYPGNQSSNTTTVLQAASTAGPGWRNMLLSGAAVVALCGGGYLAHGMTKTPTIAPEPAAAVQPSELPPRGPDVVPVPGERVQDRALQQQPDGTWKEIWRGPARPKGGS